MKTLFGLRGTIFSSGLFQNTGMFCSEASEIFVDYFTQIPAGLSGAVADSTDLTRLAFQRLIRSRLFLRKQTIPPRVWLCETKQKEAVSQHKCLFSACASQRVCWVQRRSKLKSDHQSDWIRSLASPWRYSTKLHAQHRVRPAEPRRRFTANRTSVLYEARQHKQPFCITFPRFNETFLRRASTVCDALFSGQAAVYVLSC